MTKAKLILISVLLAIFLGATVIFVVSLLGGKSPKDGDTSSGNKPLYSVEYILNDDNFSNDKLEEDAQNLRERFDFDEFSSIKIETTTNGIVLDIHKSENFDVALQYLTTQGRLYFQVEDMEYEVTKDDIQEIKVEALATNESGEAVDYAVKVSLTQSGQGKLYEACEVAYLLGEESFVQLKIDDYVIWVLSVIKELQNTIDSIQITGGYTEEEANIIARGIISEDLNYSYTQQAIIDKSALTNSSSIQ